MTLVKTTYNRRSFLKASAAAGGGMVLGFSWLASCAPAPEEVLELPDNWMDINAYLKIGDNGMVTIMSPNPEIGQGVKTSMPMVVAEELDIDWKKVVVEQAALNDFYHDQFAGGSLSIKRGWESLRMAGATARKMLMDAAADKWQVPVTELTTDGGVVKHAKSGQSAHYGELAAAAAEMEVPEEVDMKEPKDFKLIGTRVKNVDGPDIVTGKPLYGIDMKRENMKIAMIEHAPAFGMKLKSVDSSAAKTMPGIVDVFQINTKPEGFDHGWQRIMAFPDVVAVVGNSTWEVMQAKKALKVEWETDTAAENSKDHMSQMADLMSRPPEEAARQDGNPAEAFANAEKIIERSYTAPFMAHNTMEPMNFFAHVTEDNAELEGPTQTPVSMRSAAAQVLGMPEEKVSVMISRIGGGFGRRLYGEFGLQAALISKKLGAPVKLVYSREDDMTEGVYRPAYHVTYRAAIDSDNNLTALHVRGAGSSSSPVFENRFPAGAIQNYLAEKINHTTNVSLGAWRAPRSHFMAIAEQSFLDEVAEAMDKDPVDLRLELFDKAIKDPVGEDNDYDAERYAGVLKLVKEKSDWGKETPGVYRGVSAYYCHYSYVAQVVDVVMENDKPKIKKIWCAVDCGIVVNKEGALNQIEGGIVDGIGHAMYSALTLTDGRPDQTNFDKYRLIRNSEAPEEIEVFFVESEIDPTGLGEPSLPPIGAALANAMYKATGQRFYNLPFAEDKALLG